MSIVRTEGEIDEQINKALQQLDNNGGRSRWPSMAYEQGVRDALGWVVGETDDPPMEDE